MARMQSRSDHAPEWPAVAGIILPAWAIGLIVAGMVLIVLGVVQGPLFVPGVWTLILGFVALLVATVYGVVKEPA